MFKLTSKPKIKVKSSSDITIIYKRHEEKVAYDICDFNGNLIKTGTLNDHKTDICLSSAFGEFYLFILDGPNIFSKKFSLAS